MTPLGLTAVLKTSIPSFLTIFMVKDDWLIKKRSLMELMHFSIVSRPCFSVKSFV